MTTDTLAGLPVFRNDQAWLGPDLAARPDAWIHRFTPEELAEIDAVTRTADASGKDIARALTVNFLTDAFLRCHIPVKLLY